MRLIVYTWNRIGRPALAYGCNCSWPGWLPPNRRDIENTSDSRLCRSSPNDGLHFRWITHRVIGLTLIAFWCSYRYWSFGRYQQKRRVDRRRTLYRSIRNYLSFILIQYNSDLNYLGSDSLASSILWCSLQFFDAGIQNSQPTSVSFQVKDSSEILR